MSLNWKVFQWLASQLFFIQGGIDVSFKEGIRSALYSDITHSLSRNYYLEAQILFLPSFILSWEIRLVDVSNFNFSCVNTQSHRSVDSRIG